MLFGRLREHVSAMSDESLANEYFDRLDASKSGRLTASQVKALFMKSKLEPSVLRKVRGFSVSSRSLSLSSMFVCVRYALQRPSAEACGPPD